MLGAERAANPTKMGRHLLTANGAEILNVTWQEQARLDQKAVKDKFPEVAAECMKKTQFFVFRPKRKKT
jgi:hypothetical protein